MSLNSANTQRFLEETRDASPTNLLIEFESFPSFAKYGIAQYESKLFEAGGYKWKMIMYPEGYESEKEGCHVSVQFAIAETDSLPVGWKVNAIFAFFVYNHLLNNYLCFRGRTRRFDALVPKHGITKLISKKTLIDPSKGYVVDDCCVFGAEIFVIKNQPVNGCRLSLVKDMAPFKREWAVPGFSNGHPQLFGNQSSSKLEITNAKFTPRLKVKVEVCVHIVNKVNATHDSFGFNLWFTSSCRSLGFPDCLSNADMIRKGYIVGDCCFVDVEICVHAVVLDEPKI